MNEQFILSLIEKFDAGSAAELDYREGENHLILRREAAFRPGAAEAHAPSPAPASVGVSAGASAGAPVPAGAGSAVPESPDLRLGLPISGDTGGEVITSPIVATFYGAPRPDAPPFVRPGSQVQAGDALCILEAMKMMNRLEAEFDCEILSVEARSGDLVEYGQALFRVKRR